jgi:RNA recognition motif-containing protein
MNLFVSNIDYSLSEDDLMDLFSEHGEVKSVKILIDLESKKSKGFGFVLMADQNGAIAAIQSLNTRKFNGRPLSVQIARPRPEEQKQAPTSASGRKLRPRRPRINPNED